MTQNKNIRTFKETDIPLILEMFRLNTPKYFSPDEEKELEKYLKTERELYYVLEENEKLVGCGGINFKPDKTEAIISWDIFHPDHQGKGLGSSLLKHRIDKIHTFKEVKRIIVRTSQVVFLFYEKNGFQLLAVKKDYWAPGFDLYLMEYVQL